MSNLFWCISMCHPYSPVRSPMIGGQCLFSIGSQEIHALGPQVLISDSFNAWVSGMWGHVPIGPFFDFKSQLHNPRFCDGSAEGHHGSSWDSPHRGCLHHMLPIPETLGKGLGGCEIHWPQWPPYKATPNDMMWWFGSKEIWDSSSASPIKPSNETQDAPHQSPWLPCLLATSQRRNKTSRLEKASFEKKLIAFTEIQQISTRPHKSNVLKCIEYIAIYIAIYTDCEAYPPPFIFIHFIIWRFPSGDHVHCCKVADL